MKKRTLIAGRGVQGLKRQKFCGDDFYCFVDPYSDLADYKKIEDVPVDNYDIVLGCIPDNPKGDFLKYCLKKGKHVLIEKPLWLEDELLFKQLKSISQKNRTICYTAYNHRFEPHFVRMKNLINSGDLGKIYSCRMFYGNGTARLVKESRWRDTGSGVLSDLGSHLIDTVNFWFGDKIGSENWKIFSAINFENKSPDHVVIGNHSKGIFIELEMTMLMWRNHFSCDILAERGSAHIDSLCKWGPSKFVYRKRKLPSGRPNEIQEVIVQGDPTWLKEYEFFKKLTKSKEGSDLLWDKEIYRILSGLENDLKTIGHRNE